ncbi:cytochrome P450 [Streptomyces niveus]|uniref:cytochrome P450 n=1 Tax=Streptomyces niveus TaxID=193462 RepID=UPI000990665A|nr:cytochrome P450 [Streptomyces niveus]
MRTVPENSLIVPLSSHPNGDASARPAIFCPHAVSGSASIYGLLAAKLKDDFSLLAIQSAGLDSEARPHESVEEMATAYVDEMVRRKIPRDIQLCGWSMGGVISYEMARQLTDRGHRVRLVLIDSEFPEPFSRVPGTGEFLEWFAEDTLGSLGEEMGPWPAGQGLDDGLRTLLGRLGLAGGGPQPALLDEFRRRFTVFRRNLLAATDYRPGPLDADVLLIRAEGADLPLSGWENGVRGSFTRASAPGHHYAMLTPESVDAVAALVRTAFRTPTAAPTPAPAPAPATVKAPATAKAPAPAVASAADAAFLELQTPLGLKDPYTCYDRLRETAPVHPTSFGPVVLTGYTVAGQALRSTDLAVEDAGWMDIHDPQWRASPTSVVMGESLLHRNPPDHTQLRRLVNGAFVQRRIQALSGRIQQLVSDRLDDLAERGADGATVDLHGALAHPLPVSVIGEMLGVPAADWDWLRGPTAAVSVVFDIFTSDDDYARSDEAIRTLTPYFHDLIEQRRKSPKDDMISALLASRDGSSALTLDELLQIVLLLFIAGFETTVNLLTNGVAELLRHPDQLALLTEDPSLWPGAVEETLRFESPVQATIRHAVRDTAFGGVDISSGTPVVIFMGAANRDPEQFDEPARFRVGRAGPKNMTFGGGIHYCLGASLARLEATIVFRELFRRFPRLALAGTPALRPIFNLRGYSTLPVTIG